MRWQPAWLSGSHSSGASLDLEWRAELCSRRARCQPVRLACVVACAGAAAWHSPDRIGQLQTGQHVRAVCQCLNDSCAVVDHAESKAGRLGARRAGPAPCLRGACVQDWQLRPSALSPGPQQHQQGSSSKLCDGVKTHLPGSLVLPAPGSFVFRRHSHCAGRLGRACLTHSVLARSHSYPPTAVLLFALVCAYLCCSCRKSASSPTALCLPAPFPSPRSRSPLFLRLHRRV